MAADEQQQVSRRERRKAAKRERARRTGDTPEKQAEQRHGSRDPDVKDAAAGAAIVGSAVTPGAGMGGI